MRFGMSLGYGCFGCASSCSAVAVVGSSISAARLRASPRRTHQPSPTTPRLATRKVMLMASHAVTHSPMARKITASARERRHGLGRLATSLAKIAQRHEAAYRRDPFEVVGRRGRCRRPFERVGKPGVVPGDLAAVPAAYYFEWDGHHRE